MSIGLTAVATQPIAIIPKGSGDITRPVVREQGGVILNRHLKHTSGIYRLMDDINQRISCSHPSPLPGNNSPSQSLSGSYSW